MSLSYRLLWVENAIPYEDVEASWRDYRETWITELRGSCDSISTLARLLLDLLKAFTPACVRFLWSEAGGYKKMCTQCASLSSKHVSDPTGQKLQDVMMNLEIRALPKPPEAELQLMGDGKPDTYLLGEQGPELPIGSKCCALDIRMVWCNATVVQLRSMAKITEYKVHYEGWKKSWDEWIVQDSGRIRSQPIEHQPAKRRIDEKGVRLAPVSKATSTAGSGAEPAPAAAKVKSASTSNLKAATPGTAVPSNTMPKVAVPASVTSKASVAPASQSTSKSACAASKKASTKKMIGRLKGAIAKKLPEKKAMVAKVSAGGAMEGEGAVPQGLPPPPAKSYPLRSGMPVCVDEFVLGLDVRNIWCRAKVVDIRPANSKGCPSSSVKLRFVGWTARWDEWVRLDSQKVRRIQMLPEAKATEPKLAAPASASAGQGLAGAKRAAPSTGASLPVQKPQKQQKVEPQKQQKQQKQQKVATQGKPAVDVAAAKQPEAKAKDTSSGPLDRVIFKLRGYSGPQRPPQTRPVTKPISRLIDELNSKPAYRRERDFSYDKVAKEAVAKIGRPPKTPSLKPSSAAPAKQRSKEPPTSTAAPATANQRSAAPSGTGSGRQPPAQQAQLGDEDSMILESDQPISATDRNPAALGGRNSGVRMIADLSQQEQQNCLKNLQLTRDFIRTLLHTGALQLDTRNYYVRLNMGSRQFHYVAAQIVKISTAELLVKGVDTNSPTTISRTKLAYVSNAAFKDSETEEWLGKLQKGDVDNLPWPTIEQMTREKKRVFDNPLFTQKKAELHSQSTAAPTAASASRASAGQPAAATNQPTATEAAKRGAGFAAPLHAPTSKGSSSAPPPPPEPEPQNCELRQIPPRWNPVLPQVGATGFSRLPGEDAARRETLLHYEQPAVLAPLVARWAPSAVQRDGTFCAPVP